MKTLVIGGGVSGLTTGITLLEKKVGTVDIYTEESYENTVSAVAAALFYPFLAKPENLVLDLTKASLKKYQDLLNNDECGIFPAIVTDIFNKTCEQPKHLDIFNNSVTPKQFMHFKQNCVTKETLLIDTSIYLPWLYRYFLALGGKYKIRKVNNINELGNYDTLINCSALGAARLFHDKSIYASRGQLLKISKINGVHNFIYHLDQNNVSHLFVRKHDCIIGGIIQKSDSLEVDNAQTKIILERAINIEPKLKKAKVIDVLVGLRPVRNEIRLESETKNRQLIIHNYGHGGSGYTIAWGCAYQVLKLLQESIA